MGQSSPAPGRGRNAAPGRPAPRRLAALLLPPLALMGLIFFLSAQPDLTTGLGAWDTVLRKLAHTAEFALLAVLWARALLGLSAAPRKRLILAAALIAALYAATDELHQTGVEGRHGAPGDWLIDAAGIAIGAAVVHAGRLGTARIRRPG